MKHILLQKALRYKTRKEFEAPKGFSFDSILGVWISNSDKTFLIHSKEFKALASKKEDVETGEDQKGH